MVGWLIDVLAVPTWRMVCAAGYATVGLWPTPLLGPSEALGAPGAAPGWTDADRRRTYLAMRKVLDTVHAGVRDREVSMTIREVLALDLDADVSLQHGLFCEMRIQAALQLGPKAKLSPDEPVALVRDAVYNALEQLLALGTVFDTTGITASDIDGLARLVCLG